MTNLRFASPVGRGFRLFRSLRGRIRESRFVRQVAVLVGGTTVSRVLLVAAAPVLTRLYHPADFGVFAVFFSVVTIAIMACAYNYEQSIAVPKENKIAAGLVLWSFTLLFVNVLLVAIAITRFSPQLTKLVGGQSIAHHLWLVPLSLLGGGAFYILNSWAIRLASFRSLSKRRIYQSAAQILVQFAFPMVGHGPLGLLLGDSVGRMAGSTTLLREMLRDLKQQGIRLNYQDAWRAARQYWKYPVYGLPALLLHTGLTTLPPLLFTRTFGLIVAGSYSLVNQVVGVGTSFIGLAIAQVYFHKAAVLSRSDPSGMLVLFLKTSGICAAIAVMPYVCLGLFGPWMFGTVFGSSWIEAGHYAQLLAMPYFFVFVVGPVFPVLTILQRQHWQLLIDGIGVVLMVALISIVSHFALGPKYAVAAYGIALSSTYCGLYVAAGLAIWRNRTRASISLANALDVVERNHAGEQAVVS